MKEIFIIEDNFEKKEFFLNFLKRKNLNVKTINLNEIKKV